MLFKRFSAGRPRPRFWAGTVDIEARIKKITAYKNFIHRLYYYSRGFVHPVLPSLRIRIIAGKINFQGRSLIGISDMSFETNRDVLDWYERQPRALTPEFISSIPW